MHFFIIIYITSLIDSSFRLHHALPTSLPLSQGGGGGWAAGTGRSTLKKRLPPPPPGHKCALSDPPQPSAAGSCS